LAEYVKVIAGKAYVLFSVFVASHIWLCSSFYRVVN